ncbi:MAG: Asp-tRNA(Asn)/Glu-tRNA(Gln) amidotransferase subunit GatA [Kiritimatiellae bacterium]|nr:Asp-tRNA(Asn)/Glu-tRNA(Gln) amidotransferase subunit GatA [Kiritimatiellia bacterium]
MPAWNELTVHAAKARLDQGTGTSRELVETLLGAIRVRDTQIQGYLEVDEADALRQADAADALRKKGCKGKLLGIPIAVKDLLNVQGQSCRCASRILEGYHSPYDATAIARLRAEGALFVGRANMDEFAMGSTTENSAFKITRTPWNLACVPGGSSGGSGAVVAADEAIAALGTDTGGSVRLPASFCGCVGLKPTYGRVSRYGLTAFASSLDQIGPMTKDIRDAALLLQVMAGHDTMDSTSIPAPVPDYEANLRKDLAGMKLGLPKEYFIDGVDPEVARCIQQAIRHCEGLGASIVEVSLPATPYAIATYYIIACAEASANLARFDGVRYGLRVKDATDPFAMYTRTRAAGFGTEVKRRIILGTYVLSSGYYDAYYVRAQKVRALIRADFEKVFQLCDALLTPVAPTAAYRLGEKTADPLQMYLSDIFTASVNLAGICALSVPCGFTSANLPVGLQIVGPAFGEETILRVGFAYEQTTDWRLRKPDHGGRTPDDRRRKPEDRRRMPDVRSQP